MALGRGLHDALLDALHEGCRASTPISARTFSVGVSSSVSTLKSRGRMVYFWILLAFMGQQLPSLLVSVMALVMDACHAASRHAAEMVVARLMFLAPPSRVSVPGCSPVAPKSRVGGRKATTAHGQAVCFAPWLRRLPPQPTRPPLARYKRDPREK